MTQSPSSSRKSSGESLSSGLCSMLPTISSDPEQFAPRIDPSQTSLSKPVCIGEFSLDKTRRQQLGRSQVRYLYEAAIGRKNSTNLTQGISQFVAKDCEEGIDQILRWIMTMAVPNNSLKKTVHECDFVVWRGTLTRLLVSAYDVSSFSVGVKVACTKFRDVVFIRECDTQAKVVSESSRSDYQRRMCYAGFKFEQIVTVDSIGQKPDTSAPVDQNNEFIGIFKANLNAGRHAIVNGTTPNKQNNGGEMPVEPASVRLLYGAEIDCISPLGHYMEIKTQYKAYGYGKGFISKALKWWIQSYLVGIKQLVLGLHENFILNRVELLSVDSLVKSFGAGGYNSAICFAFLHSFLLTVRRYLDEAVEGTVLVAERLPTSHEFRFQLLQPGSEAAAECHVIGEEFKAHGWK